MPFSREKKQDIERKLTEAITNSESVVFVNFHGLTTPDTLVLRGKLAESGSRYMVAKKTLLHRALAAAGIAGATPLLGGEVAIVFGPDAIFPAKGVYEFQKAKKGTPKILGGILERRYIAETETMALALVPSREVLLAQLVGTMHAPVSEFVRVLGGTFGSLVTVLDQITKKKQS